MFKVDRALDPDCKVVDNPTVVFPPKFTVNLRAVAAVGAIDMNKVTVRSPGPKV